MMYTKEYNFKLTTLSKRNVCLHLLLFSALVLFSSLEVHGQTTITKTISAGIDDVEEEGPDGIFGGPGYMYNTSPTIELIRDDLSPSSGNQKIGLRFTGMTIPKNAFITSAYLTFVARAPISPNTNSGTTNLTLRGEAADNSGAFTTAFYNVSGRATTGASATWNPGSWTTGTSYNSASLVTVIQEIVNRAGWASGNAMSLIITGSGSRTAYAYEDNPSLAPKLTVTYTTVQPMVLSTSVTNVLCRGNATGAIDLSVTGGTPGYTYDWSNNGANNPDIDPQDLVNVTSGSYVVTVTDANGTTATTIATITQPASVVSASNVVTQVSAPGLSNGAIDLTVIGGTPGYTYNWSNGANNQDISGLTAGTYTVTVTDLNGCTLNTSITVSTNTNNSIVYKQLYLSDGLSMDRVNPGAIPIDNSTSTTSTLSNAAPGVVVENISSTSTISGSTVDLAHTITNSENRMLLVGISLRERTVSAITFGGVSMTLVGTRNNGTDSRIYIYRTLNPPVGTANVSVTLSGSASKGAIVGAISYSGVDQTNPLGTFVSASGESGSPSINVSSLSGELVFDVLANKNTAALSPGAGQTERWDIASGEIRGGASTESAVSSSTTMSYSTSTGKWAFGGIAIKPAAVVSTVTFTQSPVMCSPLTIKANNAISFNAYVQIISGSMPTNPNISAVIRYGATNIITLTNPTFSNGMLTWSGVRGSDITVPAGQAIQVQITTAQSGVNFRVRHDSNTYPSKINLPVSTFINVNSIELFNAAYPNGSVLSQIPNSGSSFIRIPVTDPFGASDITSVNLTMIAPDKSVQSTVLTDDNVVGTFSCGKIYQYTWLNPGLIGEWDIWGYANEGSEGVTHSLSVTKEVIIPTGPVIVAKQLYLSDPSQALDRIDPVNTNDITTAQSATLTLPTPVTVSLTATEDTEIWNNNATDANKNYGSCDKIYLNGASTAPKDRVLVRFNLSSIPSNAIVSSATYRLVKLSGDNTSINTSVHRLTNNWTEGTASCTGTTGVASWNNRMASTPWTTPGGDFFATPAASINVAGNGTYNWTITSLVQDWVSGTHSNFGLITKYTTENINAEKEFASTENGTAANRPSLSVTYAVPTTTSVTFTQNTSMCSPLTIKANQPITVRNYVSIISGTMPANPNITAQLRYNGITFATMSNPSYAGGILTWTTTIGSDLIIPAGQAISLVVTTAQSGVSFKIDYDSNTKPSLIEFPVSTYIDITSFNAYNAPFPGGSIITNAQGGSTVYLRSTVTDPFGSSDITGMTIGIAPLGSNVNATSVATSGCTRTYEYAWVTPAVSDDYNLTATAEEGYENTVVDFAYLNFSLCPLSVSASVIQTPDCSTPNGGDILLTITGGKGPYTYSWSRTSPSGFGNGAGNQLMGLSSGIYNITVVAASGCTGTVTVTLEEPLLPNIHINANNTGSLCFDGSIEIDVTGGSGNYSYFWSDGFYDEDRNGLVPGIYYVTVTDEESGCTSEAFAEIALGSPIGANVFFLHPSCSGSSDGGINVSAFGGAGTFSFLWSDGGTSKDRTGLTAGNYTLTITDIAGCTAVYLYELNNPNPITVQLNKTDPSCINSGAITLNVTGGNIPLTYDWQDLPGAFNNKDRSGLTPGNYNVTVTDDKGCTGAASITLNSPNCDSTAIDVCKSVVSDRYSVVNDPNVTSYNWTVPAGAVIVSGQGTSSIIVDWSGASPGFDQVCVSAENSCKESDEICVLIYIKEVTAAAAVAPPVCIGSNLLLLGSGGVSYNWSGPSSFTSNLENPVIGSASALNAGVYTVTVTNQNGCTASASVNVVVNPAPNISLNVIQNTDCSSDDGAITSTVTGGSSPYSYNWSNGIQTANLSSESVGSYQLTVTDANGCTDIESAVITAANGLVVQTQKTNISCFGMMNGTALATVSNGSGNYDYLWSNGSTQSSLSGLRPGNYRVTVTDQENGCYGVESVNIIQPAALITDRTVVHVNCFGQSTGAINLSVSGGAPPYNYDWADLAGTNNAMNRSALTAGNYNVTITDLNNCPAVLSINVLQPSSQLALDLNGSGVKCFGNNNGFINLAITGGNTPYTILWSNGQTDKDLSGLSPGIYTVTVTDAKLCTSTASYTVIEPSLLTLSSIPSNPSCAGSINGAIDITVSGGTSPFTYIWSNGATTQDITDLTENTYTVSVTDQNNCTATSAASIIEPDLLTASADVTLASCHGGASGSIMITPDGGTLPYSYLWSDGATTQNRTGLPGGNYSLTLTDASLCTTVVIASTGSSISIMADGTVSNITCNGSNDGSIDLFVSGGISPYTYIWNDGQTIKDRSGLSSGIYQVTVTDFIGCTSTSIFNVNEPDVLAVNLVPVNILCYGNRDGSISANVFGGTAPYQYAWSNGFSTSSISSLGIGMYSVTVTDKLGCSTVGTSFINQSVIFLNSGVVSPPCPAQNNGSITLSTSGGNGPYQYNWSDNGPNTSNRTGLPAGNYVVTVVDQNNCTIVSTYILNDLALVFYPIDPTCGKNPDGSVFVRNDGEIYAKIAGGDAPFSYIWSNGSTEEHITELSSGVYSVTVTTGACQLSGQISLSSSVCIPPVANDDFYVTEIEEPVSGNIAINDYDPNTEYPLTFLPLDIVNESSGKLEWEPSFDGNFVFTPAPGYFGTFSIPYQVCDTMELCDIGILTIRVEKPTVGLAKTISSGPTNNYDGTYDLTYEILVENMSLLKVKNIQVEDNLNTTFNGEISYTVNNVSSPDFTVNFPGYNGSSNINLLSGNDSLNVTGSGKIYISLTVVPGSYKGPYWNSALGRAFSPRGILFTDFSQNGLDPDPDQDGDPTNNNEPTPLIFCPDPIVVGPASVCIGSTTTMSPNSSGTWTSSNPAIATITNAGLVTGISEGVVTFIYSKPGCTSEPSAPVTVIGKIPALTGSAAICSGATTTLSPTTGGTWSSTNPSVAVVNNNGVVTGVASGNATFIFTETSTGCTSPPSSIVQVINNPIVSVVGPNNVCLGSTTQLSPSTGGTWVSLNPAVASVTNAGLVTSLSVGTVTFRFTSASTNCISDPTTTVTINPIPVAIISGPNAICRNSTTTLSPNAGGTWVSSNPAVASVTNAGIVTGNSAGTAQFTFTNTTTGCVSNQTASVTVDVNQGATISGKNQYCIGETATLTSNRGGGTWSSSNSSIATISSSGVVTAISAGSVNITYQHSSGSCTNINSYGIVVHPKPTVSITGASSICKGLTTTLSPTTGGTWISSNPLVAVVSNAGVVIGVNPGSATFTFTNSTNLCPSNATSPVTIIDLPTISYSGVSTLCIGGNTSLNPSSGGTWTSTNSSVASITNSGLVTALSAGTSTFRFTDNATGCLSVASGELLVNPKPQPIITGPSELCIGTTTTITPASGGSWISEDPTIATINNSGLITAISSGSARFRFTNGSTGCISDFSSSIIVNPLLNASIDYKGSVCLNDNSQLEAMPSGGTSGYTYNWSGPALFTGNTKIVDISTNGNYNLTITDSKGCTAITTGFVYQRFDPYVVSLMTEVCQGQSINLNVSAPSQSTFLWSGNAANSTSQSVTVLPTLPSSIYYVTVTNSLGCTAIAAADIKVNPKPIANLTGADGICIGFSTMLSPTTGGFWSSSSPIIATVTNAGVVTGHSAGTATFTFTDGVTGCASDASVPVTVFPRPVVSVSGPAAICIGNTTTLLPGSGGTWISNNPGIASITNAGIVTGVSAGNAGFIFTHTVTGCTSGSPLNITVNPIPSTLLSGPNEICIGVNSQVMPASGGTWISNNPLVASINNNGLITGISAGTTTFRYTDAITGCHSSATLPVTILPKPIISVSGNDHICPTTTTTLSPTSGGTWISNNPAIATVSSSGIVNGVAPGQVTFYFISSTTNCQSENSLPITIYPRPNVAIIGPNNVCINNTTSLSPATGGTWISNNTSIATVNNSGVVTGVLGGSTTFRFVETLTGCISLNSPPITVYNRPTVGLTGSNSICINGTTNLTPIGGGTWMSNNPSVASVSNSGLVTALSIGTATFIYTESSTGCSSSLNTPVTIGDKPLVSITGGTILCVGSTTILSPTSGGTWVSTNPTVASVTNSGVVTGISNGTARFTFTTNDGCISDQTPPIVVNGSPIITPGSDLTICIGETTTFSANNTGTWSSSDVSIATINNAGLVTGISPGFANFIFTDDATGCITSPTEFVNVMASPSISILGAPSICIGNTTQLAPTVGGFWTALNPGIGSVNNAGLVTGITAGVARFIYAQSSTMCPSTDTLSITVNANPIVSIIGSSTICEGSTTTLSPNSGGNWVSLSGTVASVNNAGMVTGLRQGTARFRFTSASTGCSATTSSNVVINIRPNISLNGEAFICIGGTTAFLPSAGGTWTSSDENVATITSNGIVTGVSTGFATFTFTDSSTGCSSYESLPIEVQIGNNVSLNGDDIICLGYTTQLSPASGGYWESSDPSIATVNNSGLVTGFAPGVVSFTFTNAENGCTSSLSNDAVKIVNCLDPDFNVTFTNLAVAGNVATNDDIPTTGLYSNAQLITKPIGSIASLTINIDGSYIFTANMAGVYEYRVPVCIPPSFAGCPFSDLVFTVVDRFNNNNVIVANTDFSTTYKMGPNVVGMPIDVRSLENDICLNTNYCTLSSTNMSINEMPSYGGISINANGSITYTPANGFAGQEVLRYAVCSVQNSQNCAVAKQLITTNAMSALNSTVGVDDFVAGFEGITVSGNVLFNDSDPEGDSLSVVSQGSVSNPMTISSGSYYINSDGSFAFTPNTGFSGPAEIIYRVCDDNLNSFCTNATLRILVLSDVRVNIRVYLEGALMQNGGAKGPDNRPLMRDNLRTNGFTNQNYLPTQDPYTFNTQFVNIKSKYKHHGPGLLPQYQTIQNPSVVFGVTGADAIVDWVFVELRSKSDYKILLATRSGLVQRDGDVVDLDGVNSLAFPGITADSFYVVVRHRNHLGVMSEKIANTALVDFTKPSTPVFNFGTSLNNGYNYTGLSQRSNLILGYQSLWAGDFDGNRRIKFTNPNDDQNLLFFDVLAYPENSATSSNYNFAYGYLQGDYDMNGKSKYDNPNDDKNFLFSQLLRYSLNVELLSNFNFFIEQVPLSTSVE